MRASRRNERDEIRKRSRATKAQADKQGVSESEEGVRLPAPGYTEDGQASFLGVDEPVVEPGQRGSPPSTTPLPATDDDSA